MIVWTNRPDDPEMTPETTPKLLAIAIDGACDFVAGFLEENWG